jgi:hypothetical protein
MFLSIWIYIKIFFFCCCKETMSNETIKKCLNGATNDIELDLLLAKTTTHSLSLSILNQLVSHWTWKFEEFLSIWIDQWSENSSRMFSGTTRTIRKYENITQTCFRKYSSFWYKVRLYLNYIQSCWFSLIDFVNYNYYWLLVEVRFRILVC